MAATQLNLNYLGTDYGGWAICLDLIPFRSTIISAGVGEDISFDEALVHLKECQIVGIDPTPKSHNYVEAREPRNFTLLKGALIGGSEKKIKIFKQKNPEYVSESILSSHQNCVKDYYISDAFSLDDILEDYSPVALLKIDIEGAEYDMINIIAAHQIPQVCIEFHDFCTDFSPEDTRVALTLLHAHGYTTQYSSNAKEYTLIHESAIASLN